MINNDSSSVGSRNIRPDKPAALAVKRDALPVADVSAKKGPDKPEVVIANSEVAGLQKVTATVTEASAQAEDISKLERFVEGRDEAQALNDEQKREVSKAITKVEEFMQDNQRTLNFEMAEKDNRVIITVIDQETKEVIRQIPPDDLVRMSDAIQNGDSLANGGILVQSKA